MSDACPTSPVVVCDVSFEYPITMPRDYAKSSRKNSKNGQLPGWLWMLGGLAIGLFVAFLVYLNNNMQADKENGLSKAIQETIKDVREVRSDKQTPPPEPPAARDKEANKTSFDFYYILPELEVAVPEQELAIKSQRRPEPSDEPVAYILQAGSFREHKQADELKAKLALQGITADIQSVRINADTWHRVRIGPINDMSKLNSTMKRLKDNGIQAIVVKSKT